MDRWTHGQTDECTDGRMDEWMDGRMDDCVCRGVLVVIMRRNAYTCIGTFSWGHTFEHVSAHACFLYLCTCDKRSTYIIALS